MPGSCLCLSLGACHKAQDYCGVRGFVVEARDNLICNGVASVARGKFLGPVFVV